MPATPSIGNRQSDGLWSEIIALPSAQPKSAVHKIFLLSVGQKQAPGKGAGRAVKGRGLARQPTQEDMAPSLKAHLKYPEPLQYSARRQGYRPAAACSLGNLAMLLI